MKSYLFIRYLFLGTFFYPTTSLATKKLSCPQSAARWVKAVVEQTQEAIAQIKKQLAQGGDELLMADKQLYIDLSENPFRPNPKPIHFERASTWGNDIPEIAGKYPLVTIPIDSVEEGKILISKLAGLSPNTSTIELVQKSEKTFEVLDKLFFYIKEPSDVATSRFNIKWLVIEFQGGVNKVKDAEIFIDSLTDVGLGISQRTFSLASNSSRHDWAYYSFYKWAKKLLTIEETRALESAGGAEYKTIQSILRKKETRNANFNELLKNIDNAIRKGSLNRDITVYRADSSPELLSIWRDASNNVPLNTHLPIDEGYSFTTLGPDIADWWNYSQLKNTGIILEIFVPKGTSAAYLDSVRSMNHRGYLEIILPRRSQYKVTRAYTREDGQKVLQVSLVE